MDGHLQAGVVYLGGNARQRFHDASGYGRTLDGKERERWGPDGVALSRVEAAHLLYRGELDAVVESGRRHHFRSFLAATEDAGAGSGFLVRFLVYADLRERGFYLSPAREGWPNTRGWALEGTDFVVYPRGSGPADGEIAHRVRAVGERESLPVSDLSGTVLAVVDEESDVTYFRTRRPDPTGTTDPDLPDAVPGLLLADRALLWDPPADLYRSSFFGQPLPGWDAGDGLQLSLVEAAYLAAAGVVDFSEGGEADGSVEERDEDGFSAADDGDGSPAPDSESDDDRPTHGDPPPSICTAAGSTGYRAAVARGRAVEGGRFDRRLRTYAALRERSVVPKTGFKFGADFRTYAEVDTVEDLGHSELLVRAFPAGHRIAPRDLALDVRLAHGVRKEMVFAPVGDTVEFYAANRFTP